MFGSARCLDDPLVVGARGPRQGGALALRSGLFFLQRLASAFPLRRLGVNRIEPAAISLVAIARSLNVPRRQ